MLRSSSSSTARALFTRSYATVVNTPSVSDPYRWPLHSNPTPYEILDAPRTGTYTKQRYVELVKVYHPDLHHVHSDVAPPPHVRLERFRLVVAANTVLSNPIKRSAYDRYGAGWTLHPTVKPEKWWRAREGHEAFYSAYGTGSRDDCSRNANWEDWENWQRARRGGDQNEQFAKNSTFLGAVLMVASVGAAAEVGYANSVGRDITTHGEKVNKGLSEDLRRRRVIAQECADRDERVKRFLIMRDPVGRGAEFENVWQERRAMAQAKDVQRLSAPAQLQSPGESGKR